MTATYDPETRTLYIRDTDGRVHTWTDIDLKVVYPIQTTVAGLR